MSVVITSSSFSKARLPYNVYTDLDKMGLNVRNSDFEAQMFFQVQKGDNFLILDDNIWSCFIDKTLPTKCPD